MACHYPKPAYLSRDGKVTFVKRDALPGAAGFMYIRCGMCRGCKFDHARDWAIRCYHESQGQIDNIFITLTYSPEHLPPHGSLQKSDLRKFFKKLWRRGLRFRYFACGEYGEKKGRPHYHAVIFGLRPTQRADLADSGKGQKQYCSPLFSEAWPYGHHAWSEFHPNAARYVAHYTADKLKSYAKDTPDPETGLRPYEVMDRDGQIWHLQPEFQVQSLKPAIGLTWLEKNWREVFPRDNVIMDGREYPVPRFYYKWLKDNQPDVYEVVRNQRRAATLEKEQITGAREYEISSVRDARIRRYERPHHDRK